MSTYRTLKGYNIKSVTSDPANPKEGQIWYNDTLNKIRTKIKINAAWSSGGAINTGRNGIESEGTQTANVAFGGNPPAGITGKTEEYNGTSWVYGGSLPASSRDMAMAGTQNAAVTADSKVQLQYVFVNLEPAVTAAFCVPAIAISLEDAGRLPPYTQEVPLYSSVFPVIPAGGFPPKATFAV
jgi:hypothetical protein